MLQPGATCDSEAAAAAAASAHRQARSAPTSPDGHRVPARSASAHVRASVACDSARSPVLQVSFRGLQGRVNGLVYVSSRPSD
jgi:hypothetical protein